MNRIADGSVQIHLSSEKQPATPSWLGDVTLRASHLQNQGILATISERVRVARRRFGQYDVLDCVAVLFGDALSGERTLQALYESVQPCAVPFMAVFGRASVPAASTLSRFVAALPAEPVETLRTLVLSDLLARRLSPEEHDAGRWDRQGNRWHVFAIDGTREAARQRAFPQMPDRPTAARRFRPLCAPGSTGRTRGAVIRSRTTVLQMHTHQWIASVGNPGNGHSREELCRAKAALQTSIQAHGFSAERTLCRLDGLDGTGAVVSDLADCSCVPRGKDDGMLDRADVQARFHLPPDHHLGSAESGVCRALSDCPDQPLDESGSRLRVIVATHPAPTQKKKQRKIGFIRDGVVSELFWTNLPQGAFTASDVVSLSLHRGAFETALGDEDREIDPDRWGSHSPWGQEAWQIIAQWTWNLRLEVGHHLAPEPLRTTELAPALPELTIHPPTPPAGAPVSGYAPPTIATSWKAGRFPGADCPLQPDGTLRCPANKVVVPHERRRERDGSVRIVSSASIRDCRPCPKRSQCQWNGSAPAKPRQVSVLLHPLSVGSAPLLWRDWPRRHQRHACVRLHRRHLSVQIGPALKRASAAFPPMISRAQRAHSRLSWEERLARNARTDTAEWMTLTLFGIPDRLATFLGLTPAYLFPASRGSVLFSEKQTSPSGFCCLFLLDHPSSLRFFCSFSCFFLHLLRSDLFPLPVERVAPLNRGGRVSADSLRISWAG